MVHLVKLNVHDPTFVISQFNLASLKDFAAQQTTTTSYTPDLGPLIPPAWATLPFVPDKAEITINNSLVLVVPNESSPKMRISGKSIKVSISKSVLIKVEEQYVLIFTFIN